MSAWKRFCLTESENKELTYPSEELNLLLYTISKTIKKLDMELSRSLAV